MALEQKAEIAWNNAKRCNCGKEQCYNTHRICSYCNELMLKCAYWGIESQRNSLYAWDIDHTNPKSHGGTLNNQNIVAMHRSCNEEKGNK